MDTADLIEQLDPAVDAFVPEPGRRARLQREAGEVEARWPRGVGRPALFGVAVGVKDVVRVDGLPTRAGSAVPARVLDGAQAVVVDRLRAAGAVVAGKTVTAEFAVLAPGPTRNPYDPAHTPGGSSSGSAAAVAAGMVPLAIGTQTVGSMIRPAAYCGIVGFKPTYGRIPVAGVIANAPSLDTVGIFAREVAGLLPAAGVLCDGWRPDTGGGGARATRRAVLGVPTGPYLERAEPVALAAFEAQTRVLRDAGFTVREVPVMADFAATERQLFVLNRYETARVHADWFARYEELYRPETAAAIREGQAVEDAAHARALRERDGFRARTLAAMDDAGIDLWITPAATGPAPLGLGSTGSSIMCLPWSNAGMPSLTVPAGHAPNGLPLGLQCVARPAADEQLLGWATPVESALRGALPTAPPAVRR